MTLSAIQPDTTKWNLIRKILIGRDSDGRLTIAFDDFFQRNTLRLFCIFPAGVPIFCRFPVWSEEPGRLGTNSTISEVAYRLFYYAVNDL